MKNYIVDIKYLTKSKERLEIAQYSMESKYYNSMISNLYYAAFNFMQSFLFNNTKNRWRHGIIFRDFSKYCIENTIFDKDFLKQFGKNYYLLYELRVLSDYSNCMIEDIDISLKLFKFFQEVINNVYKSYNG